MFTVYQITLSSYDCVVALHTKDKEAFIPFIVEYLRVSIRALMI